ncbi:S8 family serine peptidase [Actinomadura rubrisoli]|uniref:S8 family serine peptidase n=1 Tax=Actinomadura rubrisoli TaxID=2530368 RepID=UPI0014054FAF|nr:S8 family serine peptidase [Actinomadura rubrisoli]
MVVALIDSGVEARLPDLKGAVLPGRGYDGASRADGRADDDTELGGHGTAMAALIAGQGHGTGMVGIAPRSRILPISAALHNYDQTIRYAVDHGAKVINFSTSTSASRCPDDVQESIAYAVQHDVVVVAAAGNDGFLSESGNSPANCPGVLGVGAVDAYLGIWEKSTPGDNIMVAAPGVAVGSIGKRGLFSRNNNGTSQATALTSGVVALMRARFPRMPAREVVQRILATAKDVGPKGWDKTSGYGAIIPYLALTETISRTASNPVYDRFDQVRPDNVVKPPPTTMPADRPRFDTLSEKGSDNRIRIGIFALLAAVCLGAGVMITRNFRHRVGRRDQG